MVGCGGFKELEGGGVRVGVPPEKFVTKTKALFFKYVVIVKAVWAQFPRKAIFEKDLQTKAFLGKHFKLHWCFPLPRSLPSQIPDPILDILGISGTFLQFTKNKFSSTCSLFVVIFVHIILLNFMNLDGICLNTCTKRTSTCTTLL